MPNKITDEVTAIAIIKSFYPHFVVSPQPTCLFYEYNRLKKHKIDICVHGQEGIRLGIEIATLYSHSKALLASHKEDLIRLSYIIGNPYNRIQQGIMVFNGMGIRPCDFYELSEMGKEFGIRVIRNLSDFTRICKRKDLIVT